MNYKIFFFVLLFYGSYSAAKVGPTPKAQPSIDWRDTKNWNLYDIHSKNGFLFSIDTLRFFRKVPLNEDTMKTFLSSISEIPPDKTPVWMGYYVSSCQLQDGATIKIEVSQYGGFFYSESENRYFQLPSVARSSWLNFFTSKWRELKSLQD